MSFRRGSIDASLKMHVILERRIKNKINYLKFTSITSVPLCMQKGASSLPFLIVQEMLSYFG